MRNNKFRRRNAIEEKYRTLLQKLLLPIKKEILKANGDLNKIKRILKNASNSPTFKRKAKEIAKTIGTMTWQDNANNWREAAKKGSRGREINNLLLREFEDNPFMAQVFQELLDYNATLIETLPLNISERVINHITSKNLTGERASDIAKEIKQYFPETSKANADLIARTETSKFSSALTEARCIDLGITCYVWRTSKDARVRETHSHMDGVIIFYKHPPIPEKLDPKFKGKKFPKPYHAGNIYNCRCYQEPLIELSDVRWPCKVYNWKVNRIETMTMAKFKDFAGINEKKMSKQIIEENIEKSNGKSGKEKFSQFKNDFLEGLKSQL